MTTAQETGKVADGRVGPDEHPACCGNPRERRVNPHRRGHKKEGRRDHPQTDRGSAIVRRRCDPSRTQHGHDVEQQHIPKSHLLPQLFDGTRGVRRRLAHRVTSSAGISSSCMRKLWRKGSFEFSKSAQGPKKETLPSCRKTSTSARRFAKCVSCVTTMDVL